MRTIIYLISTIVVFIVVINWLDSALFTADITAEKFPRVFKILGMVIEHKIVSLVVMAIAMALHLNRKHHTPNGWQGFASGMVILIAIGMIGAYGISYAIDKYWHSAPAAHAIAPPSADVQHPTIHPKFQHAQWCEFCRGLSERSRRVQKCDTECS